MSPLWNTTPLRSTIIHPAWGFMTVLYCLVIYLVSSTSGILPEKPVFPGEDKLGHLMAYAGLTFVVSMGMRHARVRASLAIRLIVPILFAALYGLFDVLHQREVPGRTADVRDWMANVAGALLAQALVYGYAFYAFQRYKRSPEYGHVVTPVYIPPPRPLRHAHWAVSTGGVAPEMLERVPLRREKHKLHAQRRVRVLTEKERKRLFSACKSTRDSMLYDIVLLGVCSGLRREELFSLRWRDVNFLQGSLEVISGTEDQNWKRTVPLTIPALRCLLQRSEGRRPDAEYVFAAPNRSGRPIRFDNIRQSWKEALKRSAIKEFSFQDLRQTTTFYLARSGASPVEIADILGRTAQEEQIPFSEKKAIFERMNLMFFASRSHQEETDE